jgi:penicillin-binding protein 1A
MLIINLKRLCYTAALCLLTAFLYAVFILPDVNSLLNNEMQVPMHIYTADGELMAEYGAKHRFPVKYNNIPEQMRMAILAAEDHRFYQHFGVDPIGVARAVKELIATGSKSQGASTITMQVARNFFLSKEKTYSRKINEILLALKIEALLSKNQILELYLNKIFLGHRAYGIAAGARNYYGKNLNELNLAQFAMLAALPKAPSTHNPITNPSKALTRRSYVLHNMLELGFITIEEYDKAMLEPLTERKYGANITAYAPHITEMIRQDMIQVFGSAAYTLGLNIVTTIDSKQQKTATAALTTGLTKYTKRHPWVSEGKLPDEIAAWPEILTKTPTMQDQAAAGVIQISDDKVHLVLSSGQIITISSDNIAWIIKNNKTTDSPGDLNQIFTPGDIAIVTKDNENWTIFPNPKAEGALVSINPKTGEILALNGGYHFYESNFNRATQAKRQLGSLFKPFLYSAALDHNFNLASMLNDAPVVMKDSGENELWRPNNATLKFYGPITVRESLMQSRNLASIRLLEMIGLNKAITHIEKFGFEGSNELPKSLSLALGAGLASPLQAAIAYSAFANAGKITRPYLISSITDQNNNAIAIPGSKYSYKPQVTEVISTKNAYLINNVLEDVISKGTARRAKSLNRPDIAGKTGTTNQKVDAWFCGYTQDVLTLVWVGFDNYKSLNEYGSQVALPIWQEHMLTTLKQKPINVIKQPDGIVSVKINYETGLLATSEDKKSKFELFDENNTPKNNIKKSVMQETTYQDNVSRIFY